MGSGATSFVKQQKIEPGCRYGIQFRGCSHDVVCEKPRVVRRRRHAQHVRGHHYGSRRDDPRKDGLAPGGNINPKGTSRFQPIHGSTPNNKGMDVANPIATIWAGSLLLDHLGEHEAAAAVVSAIEKSIRDGVVTKDLGGTAGTARAGSYIAECVRSIDPAYQYF